jgi:lactoylglutathione lyase
MDLSFVTINVKNIDETVAFYKDVLGFRVTRSFSPQPEMHITFMDDQKGHVLEFIGNEKGETYCGKGISLGFYVDDIDAIRKHLETHNVEIIYGPITTGSGVKLMHARDLNGVELGFVQQ